MSKKAKKYIDITDVTFVQDCNKITLTGKHGDLSLNIKNSVKVDVEENRLKVYADPVTPYVGLYFSILKNMVEGVTKKFSETLLLNGVGYRASFSNNVLSMNLGHSHPIEYSLPEGISITLVSPTEIKVEGCDKQLVGEVAAQIISFRPAKRDPYKHKGIRRVRDVLQKKAGKKVK